MGSAIAVTLQAPPPERAALFETLAAEIMAVTTGPDSGLRPWKYTVHDGTDGSRIFRGGVGSSVVIDTEGRLWRARSLEDFQTTYTITPSSCEIDKLTPDYREMREYLPRPDMLKDAQSRSPRESLMMSDDPYRYESFAPLVGNTFRIEFTDGFIDLRLEEVTALPPPRRKSSEGDPVPATDVAARQQPFTVLFRGPVKPRLRQYTYRMTEPSFAEPLDIFIVPVSGDQEGHVYQAVFS